MKSQRKFCRLKQNGRSFAITIKKPFRPIAAVDPLTLAQVFNFAYDMSFNSKGQHRLNRSGGTHQRRLGEIFANAFQGKLAECAIYSQLNNAGLAVPKPDFSTYELGKWDAGDFVIANRHISIKSTKSFGNLLLLEAKDWNEHGEYKPNQTQYDYTFLVRIDPDCESILRGSRSLYCDFVEVNTLKRLICAKIWKYDLPGYITTDDLVYLIANDYVIKRGDLLNKTKMDATNYYVSACDMRPISEFIANAYFYLDKN